MKPCKHCRQRPRYSAMVPFCSPQCKRDHKAAKSRRSIRDRTESPQRQRSRERRAQYIEVRPKIISRDERCRWCGGPIEDTHHIRYRSRGGQHDEANLIGLCRRHHDAIHALGPRGREMLETLVLMPPGMLGAEVFNREL